MKAVITFVILCAICASSAFARIGETEAQIEARYGKPVVTFSKGKERPRKGYLSAGFRITVSYLDGVSASEIYQKPDQSKLSQTEIDTLLAANSGGGTWAESPLVISGLQQWKTGGESNERTAAYVESNGSLLFTTKRLFDLERTEKAQAEKAKLKNF